jgi:hypothetical protein
MPDTVLYRAVMEALADNPRVHADEIVVEILDDRGDIALRGTVGSLVQQVEAMRTAGDVAGVRHVEDGLDVRLMGIDGRADADTEAAVLDALGADGDIHARDVDVETPRRRVPPLGGVGRQAPELEAVGAVGLVECGPAVRQTLYIGFSRLDVVPDPAERVRSTSEEVGMALIAAGLGVTAAAGYEIYEWVVDHWFAQNLFIGETDKITDLADGFLGAAIGGALLAVWAVARYTSRRLPARLARHVLTTPSAERRPRPPA